MKQNRDISVSGTLFITERLVIKLKWATEMITSGVSHHNGKRPCFEASKIDFESLWQISTAT